MRIYIFSPIRYDFLHQRPQKLADQFLAMSIPVTYVQPSGFSELRTGSLPAFLSSVVRSVFYHVMGIVSIVFPGVGRQARTESPAGLTICSLPVSIPINKFNSSLGESFVARMYRQFMVRKILGPKDGGQVAIFQNPFWGKIIERGDFNVICYDCLDDVVLYAGNASLERFNSYEDRLIENCDFVVTTAAKLEFDLRKKRFPQPVYRIPNGVDYDWFQSVAGKMREDLSALRHPIAGYVGNIATWLDLELMRDVATLMRDVSFVLVGPLESESLKRSLLSVSNIFWMEKKPYADVPSYINAFDVCMIPFKKGMIAETTNPVKLFEYFALGKPVVSTPLDELLPYEREKLLLIADSSEKFANALKASLAEKDNIKVEARRAIAREHSWHSHAQKFLRAINEASERRS